MWWLEYEIERAIALTFTGVKRSKFYHYLYNECTEELDDEFRMRFGVDSISDLPRDKYNEAM